jgi:hypothetical protein
MGSKGPEAPPPRDYYKETTDALQAQVNMAPQLYAAEAAYRPMYQRLELGGYRNTLLGRVNPEDLSAQSRSEFDAAMSDYANSGIKIAELKAQKARLLAGNDGGSGIYSGIAGVAAAAGGVEGIDREISRLELLSKAKPDAASYSDRGLISILEQDVLPAFARSEAATQTYQRSADIADVERLGRRASEAYLNADPRSKSLLEAINAEAMRSLQAGSGLTDEQRRYALQTSRQGMADRGMAFGNQGIGADVLSTYQLGEARRTASLQNAGAVLGLNKQFTADPFAAILGRQGQAFNAGMSQQQFASGFASNIGPRLFSPESQYMSDLQGSNQQTAASYAAAKAQMQSGMMQGIGSLVGGAITGGGSFALASATKAACWVARAVYGEDNPKWLIFRGWMLNESPEWFRSLYLKHGEAFAEFIKDKPMLRAVIQVGMDSVVYPRMTRIYG